MRGIADSGQANIANVQSQTAYGETISGLYGQKQQVEQQAVQQEAMIQQSVAAATTEANIQRGRQQLESDTQLFQQVQAIEENKRAQVASLVQLSMSGGYTPQQLETLSEAYGITGEDLTTVMNASSYFDPTGEITLKEKWDWGDTGTAVAVGATAGAIFGIPGIAIGAVVGLLTSTVGNLANNWSKQMTIKGPQGLEFTGAPVDITQQVNQYYSSFEGSDQIAASVDFSFTGQADSVVFNYRGQKYKTYNEALAALKGINRNQD